MPAQSFVSAGTKTSTIDVRISYRIIQLFSEGLYASPNKAVEELVSNAFDAGATNVHVLLTPDLSSSDATIAVIDDGCGMDEQGLRQHWLIGVSNKRDKGFTAPKDRKQIGRFGIGKLATYVLAKRLTHITRIGSKYYATSIDFSKIPSGAGGGIYTEERVQLPLRVLTEKEARDALAPWLDELDPTGGPLTLFGSGSSKTWTVAIMSDLKDMATELRLGRLKWVLQTAMPLRDDFKLFVNGRHVPPAKLGSSKVGRWVLGRTLKNIPKPAPSDLQVTEKKDEPTGSAHRYGLTHPKLGRITGYAEVYKDLLTAGKSTDIERSHGFFVYVNGRLVNINDEYFGIDRNQLRHGTFSRFRMVVHIDRLDEELRSSRESLREGVLVNEARNILRGVFNFVRLRHEEHEAEQQPGIRMAARMAATPGSLTRQPIIGLITEALAGRATPHYFALPENLSRAQQGRFLKDLRQRAEDSLVKDVQHVDISQGQGIAVLDVATGVLQINTLHPFVAYFLDEYQDKRTSEPLELLAMSEVLTEAHLHQAGLDHSIIDDVLSRRDQVLRFLARATGKRNALVIAQDFIDAAADKALLEKELVAAFDSMGFSAVPVFV